MKQTLTYLKNNMNIKIIINEKSNGNVNGTMYEADTMSNVGTIWMREKEFDSFINMLTFGIQDGDNIQVEDPSTHDDYDLNG